MKKYETVIILLPEIEDEKVKEFINWATDIIKSTGGEIIKSDIWGERALAYKIKKRARGIYVLLEYSGTANIVNKLESALKYNESVMRYLSVISKQKTKKRRRIKTSESKQPGETPIPVENLLER